MQRRTINRFYGCNKDEDNNNNEFGLIVDEMVDLYAFNRRDILAITQLSNIIEFERGYFSCLIQILIKI